MNWARVLLHSIGFSSMIKWPVSLRNFPVSLEAGITWVAKCFGMSMGATASESPQNSITGISICFKALTKRLLCYQTLCDILRNHHCENPVLGDFFVSSPKFFSARVGGYSHFWGPKAPKSGVRAPKARGLRKFCEKFSRRRRRRWKVGAFFIWKMKFI